MTEWSLTSLFGFLDDGELGTLCGFPKSERHTLVFETYHVGVLKYKREKYEFSPVRARKVRRRGAALRLLRRILHHRLHASPRGAGARAANERERERELLLCAPRFLSFFLSLSLLLSRHRERIGTTACLCTSCASCGSRTSRCVVDWPRTDATAR